MLKTLKFCKFSCNAIHFCLKRTEKPPNSTRRPHDSMAGRRPPYAPGGAFWSPGGPARKLGVDFAGENGIMIII